MTPRWPTYLHAVQDKAICSHVRSEILNLHDALILCEVNVGLEVDKVEKVKFKHPNARQSCKPSTVSVILRDKAHRQPSFETKHTVSHTCKPGAQSLSPAGQARHPIRNSIRNRTSWRGDSSALKSADPPTIVSDINPHPALPCDARACTRTSWSTNTPDGVSNDSSAGSRSIISEKSPPCTRS